MVHRACWIVECVFWLFFLIFGSIMWCMIFLQKFTRHFGCGRQIGRTKPMILLARRGRWWLRGRQSCRFLTWGQWGRGSSGTPLWGWPHGSLWNTAIIFGYTTNPSKIRRHRSWACHHRGLKTWFLNLFRQPCDPNFLFFRCGGHYKHVLSRGGVIADFAGGHAPLRPTHKVGFVRYDMFFVKFSPAQSTF